MSNVKINKENHIASKYDVIENALAESYLYDNATKTETKSYFVVDENEIANVVGENTLVQEYVLKETNRIWFETNTIPFIAKISEKNYEEGLNQEDIVGEVAIKNGVDKVIMLGTSVDSDGKKIEGLLNATNTLEMAGLEPTLADIELLIGKMNSKLRDSAVIIVNGVDGRARLEKIKDTTGVSYLKSFYSSIDGKKIDTFNGHRVIENKFLPKIVATGDTELMLVNLPKGLNIYDGDSIKSEVINDTLASINGYKVFKYQKDLDVAIVNQNAIWKLIKK